MHQSIQTADIAEFVNLKESDISPLMTQCEIKVLYVGENRNGSYITKEVATKMAETLRGCPIVGWFRDEKEDFGDHGEKITIEGDEIKFQCMTKPYGFVAPDAQVWFKKFNDYDELGNSVEHEYLMTNGYLWTGQFEEANAALIEGRPQSMELDSDTLQGKWSENIKTGMDFFIINDAVFSKLCILGADVEPCFEGASVTSPKVSNNFTLDDDFKNTLFSMMEDLKNALKGGQQMNSELENVQNEMPEVQDNFEQVDLNNTENNIEDATPAFTKEEEKEEEVSKEENEEKTPEDKEEEDEDKKFTAKEDEKETEEADEEEAETEEKEDSEEDEDEKKKYSLLEEELTSLKEKYALLETENAELKAELKETRQAVRKLTEAVTKTKE